MTAIALQRLLQPQWHDVCAAYGLMLVQADVIARGYSGYNTRWAAYILEKIFPKGHAPPDLVTIFFGANDAALPDRLRLATRVHT